MSWTPKQRAFFKQHWSRKPDYYVITTHYELCKKLKSADVMPELEATEIEVFEEILTERALWFPEFEG